MGVRQMEGIVAVFADDDVAGGHRLQVGQGRGLRAVEQGFPPGTVQRADLDALGRPGRSYVPLPCVRPTYCQLVAR